MSPFTATLVRTGHRGRRLNARLRTQKSRFKSGFKLYLPKNRLATQVDNQQRQTNPKGQGRLAKAGVKKKTPERHSHEEKQGSNARHEVLRLTGNDLTLHRTIYTDN